MNPLDLFKKLFVSYPDRLKAVEYLISQGVKFSIEGTMKLRAYYKYNDYYCPLTNSFVTIMNKTYIPYAAEYVQTISFWIKGLEYVVKGVKVNDVKPAPTDEVVPLREAKLIGQKTRGTETTSLPYRCIALGKRVNIASKMQNGVVSLRAEWTPYTIQFDELTALKEAGMEIKENDNYASMHLPKPEQVPLGRLIWGFLGGLNIKFDLIPSNLEEVLK